MIMLGEEELRATLGSDPDLDDIDLVGRVRAAIEAPVAARSRWRAVALAGPPALLLAAALALVVVQRRGEDEGFRAKGGAAAASTTGIAVFRDRGQARVEAAGRISKDAALSFSYSNTGEAPYSHLMIFAIDDAGRVFWYWPGWTDDRADPEGLVAAPAMAGRDVELAEEVRHQFMPGPLSLHALFLRRAATVAEVERAVAQGATPPFGFGDDVAWQAMKLTVTP